jgi:Zn finger protein HypA/HybF involved in hydrogenase expression
LRRLEHERWGTSDFLDTIEEMFECFDYADIDAAIAAAFERLPEIPLYERAKTMQTVELKTANFWNCEECGRKHYADGIKQEFVDDADREETFRRFHDMDDYEELPEHWREFEVVAIPKVVKCENCGIEFSTEDETESLED